MRSIKVHPPAMTVLRVVDRHVVLSRNVLLPSSMWSVAATVALCKITARLPCNNFPFDKRIAKRKKWNQEARPNVIQLNWEKLFVHPSLSDKSWLWIYHKSMDLSFSSLALTSSSFTLGSANEDGNNFLFGDQTSCFQSITSSHGTARSQRSFLTWFFFFRGITTPFNEMKFRDI